METENENKTVLLGLNYSIDSLVTLFLLRKQHYKIIGVSIDLSSHLGHSDNYIPTQCSRVNLEKTKSLCNSLSIPFYAIEGQDIYKEEILGRVLEKRFTGEQYLPCTYCTHIIIYLLYLKMIKLECDFIATGHYARIIRSGKNAKAALAQSLDLHDDQSIQIGGIRQEILNRLLLPLGDLSKKEVKKIFNQIYPEIDDVNQDKEHQCRVYHDISKEITLNYSKKLKREYLIKIADEDNTSYSLNERQSYDFAVGDCYDRSAITGFKNSDKDNNLKVINFDFNNNQILLDSEQYRVKYLVIRLTRTFEDLSRLLPRIVYVRVNDGQEYLKGDIFFRSHQFAIISLAGDMEVCALESLISLYTSIDKFKKLLGQGKVMQVFRTEQLFEKIKDGYITTDHFKLKEYYEY
ncbi:MAG: hypothetical protein H6620_06045 [Halobacteriovoraceae bacterium]|nr:hypothetical protein [Halobacteriovoraceae bacterium]